MELPAIKASCPSFQLAGAAHWVLAVCCVEGGVNRDYKLVQKADHIFFLLFCNSFQSHLSREKEELEAEKRDLVRTSERRSQEVEHLNGIAEDT